MVDMEVSVCMMPGDMCPLASVWHKMLRRLMAEELECEGTLSSIIAVHFGLPSGLQIV